MYLCPENALKLCSVYVFINDALSNTAHIWQWSVKVESEPHSPVVDIMSIILLYTNGLRWHLCDVIHQVCESDHPIPLDASYDEHLF